MSTIDKKTNSDTDLISLKGAKFVVTDDISTKDILTTAGSKILENYIPPFNATVFDKLIENGAVLIGKVKISEFGLKKDNMMCQTLDSKDAVFGIGTSMVENKISMKTTYGLVSRYGVISKTSSFDQIVPVTNSVDDMALVLNAIVGYDKRDSASIDVEKIDYIETLKNDTKELKIAIAPELFKDSDVELNKVLNKLKELSLDIKEVSLDNLKYLNPVYDVLSSAEFASNMARYDGISIGYRTSEYSDLDELYKKSRSEGFSKEAKEKILFGNYVISSDQYESYYKKAQKIRGMIKEELINVTEEFGLLVMPFNAEYDLVSDVSGLPSISMPFGIQILGSPFKEADLLRLAYDIEKKMDSADKEVRYHD